MERSHTRVTPPHLPTRALRRAQFQLTAVATVLVIVGVTACDERSPTGADTRPSAEIAGAGVAADVVASSGGVGALGTIPLPVNQTAASSGVLFGLTQTGTGPLASFTINNTADTANAVLGQTNGRGAAVHGIATGFANAGFFESTNTGNPNSTIFAKANHIGLAGLFSVNNFNSSAPSLVAQTVGTGPAVVGSARTGAGGKFSSSGKETVLATNTNTILGAAIHGVNSGQGNAAVFENAQPNNAFPVLAVTNKGAGFAGVLLATTANGKGLLIQTSSGSVGLQVSGGTKNAVVRTPDGAKALYTEESTEVWFTDYGFGKLKHGRARVLLDPSFAQTINPDEPYHVFLQARGRAELYVGETTPLGFEVALKDGDPNAEFSYRVVAKRLGFEGKRLDRAPWVDQLSSGLAGESR